jgi:hypothetical protein
MHVGPGQSWRVSVSEPFDLLFALYVRDAVGIAGTEDAPPLAGTVARWSPSWSSTQRAEFAAQWVTWWTALLANRPHEASPLVGESEFSTTRGAPELREAQQALVRRAHEFRSGNRRAAWQVGPTVGMMPTDLVREIEGEIGRRAQPFAYTVEVVPTQGARHWALSRTGLLVSDALCSDPVAFREVLRPRLTALA